MIRQLVFDDEIVLWWEKGEFDKKADSYTFYINGEKSGETRKTHCAFRKLDGDTEYSITIIACKDNVEAGKRELFIRTKKGKKKIDVTCAPYFAVGDGKTLNTEALQKAIDDCDENSCVYFPFGVFLTGALKLHRDMELYVDKNATLQGSVNVEDYLPKQRSRFEGVEGECYQSLLNLGKINNKGGYNSKNVIIRGGGTILGGGRELLQATMEAAGAEYRITGPYDELSQQAWRTRGRLIEVCNSENVIIAELTLGMSSSWNLQFVYSRDITTFGCKVLSHGVNNGDGWDPDSSENCVVFDTIFDTGDDCIAIKSGKNPEGNVINRPSKNIYIFDCNSLGGHGFSIGSEMSGGVENVFVWDCDMRNCGHGLQVKGTKKRGGYVKNVHMTNCDVSSLLIWSIGYNDDGEGSPYPPVFSDYYFTDVTVYGSDWGGKRRYICFHGFDEDGYEVNNVILKNVKVSGVDMSQALSIERAKNIVCSD